MYCLGEEKKKKKRGGGGNHDYTFQDILILDLNFSMASAAAFFYDSVMPVRFAPLFSFTVQVVPWSATYFVSHILMQLVEKNRI